MTAQGEGCGDAGKKMSGRQDLAQSWRNRLGRRRPSLNRVALLAEGREWLGRAMGGVQGLSNVEGANSESVDELLEEGTGCAAVEAGPTSSQAWKTWATRTGGEFGHHHEV